MWSVCRPCPRVDEVDRCNEFSNVKELICIMMHCGVHHYFIAQTWKRKVTIEHFATEESDQHLRKRMNLQVSTNFMLCLYILQRRMPKTCMSLQVCWQLEGEFISDEEIDEMFRCADIACDFKDGR